MAINLTKIPVWNKITTVPYNILNRRVGKLIPLAKNIKRFFSLKEVIIVSLAIIISISAGVGTFLYLKKEVVVNDNGKQITVKTMKTTVKEVLEQNGISVNKDDYISQPLEAKLLKMKRNEIDIKRAVPVYVLADGQKTKLMTYKDTIRDALADSSITMLDSDRLDGSNLDDKIVKDMEITIVRVREEVVSEKTAIPFRVVSRANNSLDQGKERTIKEGKEGTREKLFRVVLEDGKEATRELLKDAVVFNPVDQIIEYGTVLNHKTSRGDVLRYRKILDMKSTAYTSSFEDTGKNPGHPQFGITYTGVKARKGIIAVDPKVIPLGTRVYVELPGGATDYGYAVAADIGSAVKGKLIDVYLDDSEQATKWGVKRVKVYILIN